MLGILLPSVALLPGLTLADSLVDNTGAVPIPGFSSSYTLKASNVPFSITAERTLKKMKNGDWQMRIEAGNWLGTIRETTLFNWQECLPQPTYYGYHRRGLGQSRSSDLHFDREQQMAVLYRNKEQVRSFEISEESTDILSVPLALQCELSRNQNSFSLEVASERRLQQYQYQRMPEERLRTPLGRLDTIPIIMQREEDSDRRSIMWFAPSLDYTLVKMVQEDDGEKIELLINKYK